jgi:hypothetical protein
LDHQATSIHHNLANQTDESDLSLGNDGRTCLVWMRQTEYWFDWNSEMIRTTIAAKNVDFFAAACE